MQDFIREVDFEWVFWVIGQYFTKNKLLSIGIMMVLDILSMDPILKNLRKFMRLWMFFIGVSDCILAWVLHYRGYIGWNFFIRWISIWYIGSGFDLELIVMYLMKWIIRDIMMFITLWKVICYIILYPWEFESLIFEIWSCIGQLKDWCLNLGVVELVDMIYWPKKIYQFDLCYSYDD